MIIVIVVKEKNPKTGWEEEVVSHGVDTVTGRNVVMSCGSPASVGAVWDASLREYVIPD